MRIDLRIKPDETAFGVEVDPAKPPSVVKPRGADGPTVKLDWERALDDQRHLRHCPVCGATDLFARKRVPQLTSFVILVAAAVGAMVFYGFGLVWPAVTVLVVLVAVDAAIFLFAPRVLECYRCHSAFRMMPIRRDHPRYDKATAERYRREPRWSAPVTLPAAPAPDPHADEATA